MNSHNTIKLLGRKTQVNFSKAAYRKLSALHEVVHLEMQLHFSCMIKKSIFQIKQMKCSSSVKINSVMSLSFSAITTNVCAPKNIDIHNHESIEITHIDNPERFVPDWVSIDYEKGVWGGIFGYGKENWPS
jgi:hypothetical protein